MSEFNESQIADLQVAIEQSRDKLSEFRENRVDALNQYVGSHYSDHGASDKVPINLIELAVSIYTQNLISGQPKALISTTHDELRRSASLLELACNKIAKETGLQEIIETAVREAMFSVAIVKVGMEYGRTGYASGHKREPGQCYAQPISLDDWVHDVNAKRLSECQFMGHYYHLRLDYIEDEKIFDAEVIARLKKMSSTRSRFEEKDGIARADEISNENDAAESKFAPTVRLLDVWLPYERKIVTMEPSTRGADAILHVEDWKGPQNGPYHVLGFTDVPDNVMPLAPVSLWIDLHDIANRMFRKIGRQGERQKTIMGVTGAGGSDADRIVQAGDGQVVRMDSPESVKEFRFGGVDQASLAFFVASKDIMSWLSGNLDVLGGLSAQSPTLGQDQILNENASRRIRNYQERTLTFTRNVLRDMVWYLWYDKNIELPLYRHLEGTPDIGIKIRYTAEERKGDYIDYNFEISPYSMQSQTPQTKLATLTGVFQNFLAPFAQMMEQQGVSIDYVGLMRLISKWSGLSELSEVLVLHGGQSLDQVGPVAAESNKPSVTKRTYERVNRPGATRAGKDDALIRLLSGSKIQGAEAEGIVSPTT
jgi:hypothetical protein